jgi:hypothetical protein
MLIEHLRHRGPKRSGIGERHEGKASGIRPLHTEILSLLSVELI